MHSPVIIQYIISVHLLKLLLICKLVWFSVNEIYDKLDNRKRHVNVLLTLFHLVVTGIQSVISDNLMYAHL